MHNLCKQALDVSAYLSDNFTDDNHERETTPCWISSLTYNILKSYIKLIPFHRRISFFC